jgi:hypothetical protein
MAFLLSTEPLIPLQVFYSEDDIERKYRIYVQIIYPFQFIFSIVDKNNGG